MDIARTTPKRHERHTGAQRDGSPVFETHLNRPLVFLTDMLKYKTYQRDPVYVWYQEISRYYEKMSEMYDNRRK